MSKFRKYKQCDSVDMKKITKYDTFLCTSDGSDPRLGSAGEALDSIMQCAIAEAEDSWYNKCLDAAIKGGVDVTYSGVFYDHSDATKMQVTVCVTFQKPTN